MSETEFAIITGTSRGLGLALALDLARDREVLGVARGELDADAPSPTPSRFRHASGYDLCDSDALDRLDPDLKRADLLINNAGVAYDGLLATQSPESIERTVALNLVAVLQLTKRYVRARLAVRKPGIVISIGSIVGIRGYAGLAAYGAAKGALSSMNRALAREMGSKGFRFNTVLPGYFESELSRGLGESQLRQIVRRTPLGRLAEPADIVPVVRFLASPAAGFITGQEIVVDGGLTA